MSQIPNMLESTIQKIREMVDVNSVIGEPISTPDGAYHDAQQRPPPAVPGADAQRQDSQKEYHAQRNPPAHYASSPAGGCSGSSTGSPKVIFSMGGSSSRELRPKVRRKSGVVLY